MRKTIKKHKKKTIVASIIGGAIMAMTYWSDIYPVVCPLLNIRHQEVCQKLGKVVTVVLDESKLDEEVADAGN